MTRRALITRLGPVVALVLLLVPYPYLAVPDWDVQVVNDQGAPMEDMTVRLTYVNYSAESSGHSSTQRRTARDVPISRGKAR